MNTIDEAMIAILQKRLELSKLSYSDDTYDDVEEVLHDLEDDFNEKYGDHLEEILESHGKNDDEIYVVTNSLPNYKNDSVNPKSSLVKLIFDSRVIEVDNQVNSAIKDKDKDKISDKKDNWNLGF